jgi:hypothetical protein
MRSVFVRINTELRLAAGLATCLAVWLVVSVSPVSAQTITFTGAAGTGDWNNPQNWNPARLPVESDWVVLHPPLGMVVYLSGSSNVRIAGLLSTLAQFELRLSDNATFTLDGTATLTQFLFQSGRLSGGGGWEISQAFWWDGGSMDGPSNTFNLDDACASSIRGDVVLGRSLTNRGYCAWRSGNITLINGPYIYNYGEIDILGNNDLVSTSVQCFANYGRLIKYSSGTTTFSGSSVYNEGTISPNSGTLRFVNGSMSSTGTIDGASGATLEYGGTITANHTGGQVPLRANLVCSGGTVTFASACAFTPTGSVTVSGGTTTIQNTVIIPNLILSDGTLTGSSPMTLNGFTWHNGTLAAATSTATATVSAGVNWTLDGAGDPHLQRDLTNLGTCNWTGGSGGHTFCLDHRWTNGAGSVFRAQVDNQISSTSLGEFRLDPGSTFEKSGGSGTTTIGNAIAVLPHNATISVLSGTLAVLGQFDGYASHSLREGNTYNIAGIFRFPNTGIFQISANVLLDGPGSAIQNTDGTDALTNFEDTDGSFTIRNGRCLTTPSFLNSSGTVVIGPGPSTWTANGRFEAHHGVTRLDGGTLTVTGGLYVDGTLEGNGLVQGSVDNLGILSPGISGPGAIHITGSYQQHNNGTLVAEIGGGLAGDGYDSVVVDGAATLTAPALLQPSLIGGYIPPNDLGFDVLSAQSLSGAFSSTGLPLNFGGGYLYGVPMADRYRIRSYRTSYTISASAGAGGAIVPAGDIIVQPGANQDFVMAPDSCDAITDVVVDGVSRGAIPSYRFSNVQADHTIRAIFAPLMYTITATSIGCGAIDPSGAIPVACGTDASFRLRNDAGCYLYSLIVDGQSIPGSPSSYTFHQVHENHSIQATFSSGAPPQVAVTRPNGGEEWIGGATENITWYASDDAAVTAIDLACSFDNGLTWPRVIATGIPNSGTYGWTVPDTTCSTVLVRATAHDLDGHSASDASDAAFLIADPTSGVESTLLGPGEMLRVWPNPNAGGSARVIYRVNAGPAAVELAVYDAAGRLVRRLTNGGVKAAGVYTLTWDRRDEHGAEVASGIYLVRLSGAGVGGYGGASSRATTAKTRVVVVR